jgi:hypothetical protein
MTASKKGRPWTGRSKTWVRLIFELTDREAVVVASRAFRWRHRPRQSLRPAVEKGLHIGWTERITRRLERGGVSAG